MVGEEDAGNALAEALMARSKACPGAAMQVHDWEVLCRCYAGNTKWRLWDRCSPSSSHAAIGPPAMRQLRCQAALDCQGVVGVVP